MSGRPAAVPGLVGLSWLSAEERAFLIEHLPERGRFLEVGSASGVTAAIVADARPGLEVVCVDPFPDHDAAHVVAREPCRVDAWRRNRRPTMSLWLGTLAAFEATRPGAAFDAILVDGAHDAGSAAADLAAAVRLVAPGGTLFVHDYGDPGHPEVARAADALGGLTPIASAGTLQALGRSPVIRYPCGCVNESAAPLGVLRSVSKCAAHAAAARDPATLDGAYYAELGVVDEAGGLRPTAHVAELVDALGPIEAARAGGRALEVGCGASPYVGALRAEGWEYTGLDASPWAAGWLAERWGVGGAVGDWEGWEPPGRYGLILAAHVAEHLRDAPAGLAKMAAALAPGGVLYLVVPDASDPTNPDHRWFFTPRTLRAVAEGAGLRVERLETRRVVPHENFLYMKAWKGE